MHSKTGNSRSNYLVQFNLLEEALGRGVVISSLVGEVGLADVVDLFVYACNESRHCLTHFRLHSSHIHTRCCVDRITRIARLSVRLSLTDF